MVSQKLLALDLLTSSAGSVLLPFDDLSSLSTTRQLLLQVRLAPPQLPPVINVLSSRFSPHCCCQFTGTVLYIIHS